MMNLKILMGEELPNEEAQGFYQLLNEMNTSLFEGSSDSKLSMCVRLLAPKSNWNWTGLRPKNKGNRPNDKMAQLLNPCKFKLEDLAGKAGRGRHITRASPSPEEATAHI
jgi:hypothetical protein